MSGQPTEPPQTATQQQQERMNNRQQQQNPYAPQFTYGVPSQDEPVPFYGNQQTPPQQPATYDYGYDYSFQPQQPQPQQQSNFSYDDHSLQDEPMVYADEATQPTHQAAQPLTAEELTRKRFAMASLILMILCILLVIVSIITVGLRALEIKDGIKAIATLIVSAVINFAVIVAALAGVGTALLNRPGMENLRLKAAYVNTGGMLIMAVLQTLYLIITTLLIPLVGIPMFMFSMITVVIFYGPVIVVGGYRLFIMRVLLPSLAYPAQQATTIQ